MRESFTGRISRREAMKRGAVLGLSASMMGHHLGRQWRRRPGRNAGCWGAAAGWSITVPEGLPDLTGVELNVMLGADGPGAPFDQASVDKFAEATGATVNYVKGAESATERLTFLLQTMAAQSSDIDAAMIDVIWPGIFASHAVDLSDQVGDVGFFERIMENNTVDGKLVGLPWYTDAGLLYYRTDLLEKYGFEGPRDRGPNSPRWRLPSWR
jgi:trehalose/maltose transport system substrate-binding protein